MTPTDVLDDTLPDSVLAMIRGKEAEPTLTDDQLKTFTTTILTVRAEHKNHRQQSGIEEIWRKYEEAYIGMDDGNRHEFRGQRYLVPATMDAPLRNEMAAPDTRCTLYVRLTARYVDAGKAKVCELLIHPADGKSYSYGPTPVPSLIAQQESKQPVLLPDGTPAERDATPTEQQSLPTPLPQPTEPGAPPPLPPGVPLVQGDLAMEEIVLARKKAKKAERRVDDWKAEANYAAHLRRVVGDSARIGVGVMKGPFPCLRKSMAITTKQVTDETGQRVEKTVVAFEEKLCPDWAAVSPWDVFPSPSCGENVRNGQWFFHRDRLSRRQVEDLGELPGYIKRYINQVLEEGPNKSLVDMDSRNPGVSGQDKDTRYEVWYAYGSLTRDEWSAIQDAGDYAADEKPKPLPENQHSVYAIVTLINDCIVYASVNPLKSGTIPFYTFSWQDRPGSWAGVGIGEQVDMPQRELVSAVRAMLDNAGVSAGAQIVIDRGSITPFDMGDYTIRRNKLWEKSPECDDVSKAFAIFQIPNITREMLLIAEQAYKIAEDSCNIPLISQGQSGKTTPDTYGGQKLQDSNANQLLRGIASTVDDSLTEPESKSTYEWLLLDPNVPEDEKGDFQINAHGSSALVERALQDQAAIEVLQLVASSGEVLGADPKRTFAEYLKSRRLDPEKYMFSKEELEAKSKQPPPKAPQVQAAEINAQATMERAKLDTDRDRSYVEAETARTIKEHEARMQELAVKRELALLDYANQQKISLDNVKAQLAETGMKLAVQKELSAMADSTAMKKPTTSEAVAPPTEPEGRAAPGESFQA